MESLRVKQFEDDEHHRRSMLLGEEELTSLKRVLERKEFGDQDQTRVRRSMSEPLEMFCRDSSTVEMRNGDGASSLLYVNTNRSSGLYVNTTDTTLQRCTPLSDNAIVERTPDSSTPQWSEEVEVGEERQTWKTRLATHEEEGKVHENLIDRDEVERKGGSRMLEEEDDGSEAGNKGKRENGLKEDRDEKGMKGKVEDRRKGRGENGLKEVGDNGVREDYNSDEFTSSAKFKSDVRSSLSGPNEGDTLINGECSSSPQDPSLLSQESLHDSADYTIPVELDKIRERYRSIGSNGTATLTPSGTGADMLTNSHILDSTHFEERGNWIDWRERRFAADLGVEKGRTFSAPEIAPRENENEIDGEGSYEFPSELVQTKLEVSPYEDPASLGKGM